jgi:hypothetical protein
MEDAGSRDDRTANLRRTFPAAVLAALWLTALVVACRAADGSVTRWTSPSAAWLLTAAAGLAGAGARLGTEAVRGVRFWLGVFAAAAPSAVLGGAVAPPTTAGITGCTAIAAASAVAAWGANRFALVIRATTKRRRRAGAAAQTWWSQTSSGGRMRLRGSVAAEVPAGQRTLTVHVPFVPPFAEAPQVEAAAGWGDAVRVQVAEAAPWGMRLEIRRTGEPGAAAPFQLLAEVSGRSLPADLA